MKLKFLFFALLICGFAFGQTEIFNLNGSVPLPSDWVATNNVTTQPIQQSSYYLVEAGASPDVIVTSVYDLSSYSTATFTIDVATYGAGANNPARIEISYDGINYSQVANSATPTSATYITTTSITLNSTLTNNVRIRIFNNGSSGRGVRMKNIKLTAASATPSINVTPTTLTGLSYTIGNGPSAEQSFSASATNLSENLLLSAPTNYEISTSSGTGFGSSVTLTPTSGTVASTPIYTRLKAGLPVATYNQTITATSTGATNKTVSLSGNVTAPPSPALVLTPTTLNGFVYAVGNGPSAPQNFTASGSALTANMIINAPTNYEVSLTSGSGYISSISLTPASGTIAPTTIYTRLKTGLSVGTYNETITATSTGASNVSVALTGKVTNSNTSDIITTSSFSYMSNHDYLLYQAPTITSTSGSVGVFKFTIRDGAGLPDVDLLGTELTSITFNVTNIENIRNAALFGGATQSTQLNNTPTINVGAGTITFSGLSGSNFTAADGGVQDITLRITYLATVTDNHQLRFTIASATANPSFSTFGTANAGGAVSSTTSDINRIEVTADRLAFLQQPTTTSVSTVMTPAPTVQAIDINSNRDLDFNTATSVTSTGVLTGSPVAGSVSAGLITFSGLTHTVQDTFRTLTATTVGLLVSNNVTSGNFDINDVPLGTYRTTSAGTWPGGATPAAWERLTAGTWSSVIPPANSTNLLSIRHNITSAGAFAATGGTIMKIENGGTFNAGHNCTFKSLTVESGGKIVITNPAVDIVSGTGTVTVENNGRVIINSSTLNLVDGFWQGIENFKAGSFLEIQNWDWDDATANERLIGSANTITTNLNGYYFGNITINGAPVGKSFTLVGIIGTHKLCENDLTINNTSNALNVIVTTVNANVEIGGDLIVNSNKFSFGAVSSSDVVHTVRGNIILNGGIIDLNQTSAGGASVVVNLEGNLSTMSGSTLTSVDGGCKIVFNKSGIQTVNIAGSLGVNLAFEVGPTSTTRLINRNLDLTNASNKFTVLSNGILEFNNFDITGSGDFIQEPAGVLKITSAGGINATGATGNVINTGTRNFSQLGHFYYVGSSTPQSTGNAMTVGSTAKIVVVEKTNPADVVNLTQSTATTNELRIVKGNFVETEVANISGSGNLIMNASGKYLSAVTSATVPKLSGSYVLDTGSTIELNAFGNQTLRGGSGGYVYRNLTFSKSGIKTISSATPDVLGTILISDAAILDVDNKTMGGSGTNLTMTGTSEYRTAGVGVKPDATGTYTLGVGTKVRFTSGSIAFPISTLQEIRLAPNYYNIDIVGNNVGTNTLTGSIKLQNGGTFNVTSTGVFKHSNTSGFSGVAQAAISNATTSNITLQPNSTVEYAGSNQTISLFNTPHYTNVTISGTGVKTLQSPISTFINENLDVVSGKLLVEVNKALTVKQAVKISSLTAEIEVDNNGQLIQIDELDSNIGTGSNFKVNRIAQVKNYDYVYWSSPADGFTVAGLPHNNRYIWDAVAINANGTQGNWLPATGVMQKGRGYIARISNASPTASLPTPVVLSGGKPYNGQFTTSISRGTTAGINDCLNLIGNPYPSALDADSFLAANPVIEGSVRIWMHGNSPATIASPFYQNFTYNYDVNDYIIYNGTAATIPAAFTGDIASGQGFFIRMLEAGESATSSVSNTTSVTFKNSFRKATDGSVLNNSEFYRSASENTSVEKSRVWLDLISPENKVSKTVIGYVTGATGEKDRLYDAVITVFPFSFYSLIEHYPLGIQGRSLPFDSEDTVPLGMSIQTAGQHSIAINSLDGLFSADTQSIYLEDLDLGKTHDLKLAPYSFHSAIGTFNNRFILKYTTESLTTNDFVASSNLEIITNKNQVSFKSANAIAMVQLYDMLGRLIYESAVDATYFTTSPLSANGVLIAKVIFENGQSVSRKIQL